MAISWGGWNGRLQVGIDVSQSPSSPSNGTTSVTLTIRYYVRTDGYNFADTQTLKLSGDVSGSVEFYNSLTGTNESKLVATRTRTVGLSYSSRASRTFKATLSGAFNGATPTKTRGYTAPYRPAAAPGKVGRPTASPLSTVVDVRWSTPASNGAAVDKYDVLVERPTGGDIDRRNSGTDNYHRMYGMSPGGDYTVRVRAHNSAGWGPWSDKRSFSTAPLPPGKVARPTISAITSSGCNVNYKAPASNGASIDKYEINLERASSSTDIGRWTDPNGSPFFGVDGLNRASDYVIQVRAHNSAGWGDWSDRAPFTTAATRPDKPARPTAPAEYVTTQTMRVYYENPNTGGDAITTWQVRLEDTSGTVLGTFDDGNGPPYYSGITGLQPGRTYRARVRMRNAVGWSDWSEPATFRMLSAVKVGDGTEWIDALLYIGNGTDWVLAEARTGTGTGWAS
ncbi:fibronectin type III domain-containing protein [Isoptericola dokdonensis]|uniref:Fibronectin type III domain protein n=1 Tax=Isoptericola dokdonensis DS-3 TaxID=1300344 RepID=A0A161HYD9_9MICO|nr:fibronectin type III domain-containing protein [Isoptericola dokdonensis]ANC31423.1 Fibronectin type III domain protein [Isoptericola dokdonensis DS-3]